VGGGFPLALVCPFAGARPHLGSSRGHSDPPCPPMFGLSTRLDRSPLITVPSQAAAVLRMYAEAAKVSSNIESADSSIMLDRSNSPKRQVLTGVTVKSDSVEETLRRARQLQAGMTPQLRTPVSMPHLVRQRDYAEFLRSFRNF
jgi:hypothetical protein